MVNPVKFSLHITLARFSEHTWNIPNHITKPASGYKWLVHVPTSRMPILKTTLRRSYSVHLPQRKGDVILSASTAPL